MKMSLKPTLFTFIPVLIIFGWLNGHLLYDPVGPGDIFSLTAQFIDGVDGVASLQVPDAFRVVGEVDKNITEGQAVWQIKAERQGDFLLDVVYDEESVSKRVLVTEEQEYAPQKEEFSGVITSVGIGYEKLVPLPSVSIFGWHPGWLGWYIMLSLVFSISMRKLLGLQ